LAILNTGKKIWYLKIDDDIYKLRNEKSFNAIFNFSVVSSLIASNTYYFKNNIETVKIKNSRTASFFDIAFGKYLSNRDNNYDNPRGTIESIYIIDLGVKYKLLDFIKSNDLNIKSIFRFPLIVAMHDGKIIASENYNSVSIKTNFTFKNYSFYLSDPDRYMIKSSMRYDLEYKLQYLEKIESFKIEKIPFFELINKYNLYRY
jgi:hypothetical protein